MSTRHQEAALLGSLFRSLGEWVPGRTLAEAAELAPATLPQILAPYVQAGYPIEFHPQGNVRLSDPPDIWCAEEILGRCPPRKNQPAWDPLLLAETSSTNDVAREQASRGVPAGFVVAASRQTRGRGRLGRAWESTRDAGLYVSILLRPELAAREAGRLTILSSVATADAVEMVSGLRPQIKWPNDLVIEGRKLAGLLLETELTGMRLTFAVIGIGLNVNHTIDDFSPKIRTSATSLCLSTGRGYRRADLLVALLNALGDRLAGPFEETREAWAASSLTLGQRVTLTTLRGVKHGHATGLDAYGALLLRGDSGEVETITAGDCELAESAVVVPIV